MKAKVLFLIVFIGLVACSEAEEKVISNPVSSVVEQEVTFENNDTILIGGIDGVENNAYTFDGKRDELIIELLGVDSILLREKLVSKEELKKQIRYFYSANLISETDAEMLRYNDVSASALVTKISSLGLITQGANADPKLLIELKTLELKQKICGLFPQNSFREISSQATIKIEIHPKTKKGRYDEIRDIVYEIVSELRSERSKSIKWKSDQEEEEKKSMLEVLVPERVVSINVAE